LIIHYHRQCLAKNPNGYGGSGRCGAPPDGRAGRASLSPADTSIFGKNRAPQARSRDLHAVSPVAPAVACHALTRRFGSFVAVDHLDLEVGPGETFGLLGRNGAGKTTLLKMLTTLLPVTSGTAHVAGFDVTAQPARVRRAIGYVPQALSADGDLTGYENLLVFARLYDLPAGERRERIATALAFMGLSDDADRVVKHYSGGMIRRLEIAQSTLHRPQVLFLDEPTVGLDPLAREVVWDQLRRLHREFRTTIVLTTHHLDEAEALCGRIAIMHRGRVSVVGAPAALRARLGPEATLADVFAHYTGDESDALGGLGAAARARHTAERLG
jgi:ABC-2 type transport system ATP-binding protein